MNAGLRRSQRGFYRIGLVLCLMTGALLASAAFPQAVLAQQNPACADELLVQPGDSLSAIAARALGSPSAFLRIVEATNRAALIDGSFATIDDPGVISAGWKICLSADVAAVVTSRLEPGSASGETSTQLSDASDQPSATNSPTLPPEGESEENSIPGVVELAPGELHPLSIERMREQEYPGSDLVVEQVLAPGTNYDRSIVSYQSEGNKILALLTVPQGEMPESGWPVIIFNHGYIPPEIYRTTERYIAYVDGFARSGYMVLRPDYRGHGFSEGEARGSYSTPDYTIDVLNAVASVKQHPKADPERMGMWGHSMGGHITLRNMVTTNDIKAGVIWAGVVASYPDLIFNWHRSDRYAIPMSISRRALNWRTQFQEAYGTPEENPEFWASISPISYVEDLSGPIQLHHGTNDESVPAEFSAQLEEAINAVDGAVEYYVYEGDNHNLSINFSAAMARSIAFFDQYVK